MGRPSHWTEKQRNGATREVVCVDLFCGAGGLTHGLIKAGVRVVAGVDVDGACQYPYEANNAATFYERDVTALSGDEIKKWFGNAEIRVLAGCAPCQPFSTYSQRYETEGTERWGLLSHFARLVEDVRPDIVTMENVPSVTRHSVFREFLETLEECSYEVWKDIVNSADYGLPQSRSRTVLLASLLGPVQLRPPAGRSAKTVRTAIGELPPIEQGAAYDKDRLHTASRLSALNLERIQASEPGGTWRDWPEHLIAECHRRDTGRSYPGVYGRMVWDEPAPTLTTQFYGFGNGRFGHPEQDRGLSLREGAMLQGFPKKYAFVPRDEPVQFKVLGRLIGNAVPVDLGKVIGKSILDHVAQHASSKTSRRRRNGREDRQNSAVLS